MDKMLRGHSQSALFSRHSAPGESACLYLCASEDGLSLLAVMELD